MVSIRTKYRLKRIYLLGDSITDIAVILIQQKRILEKVHLKHFNSVRNSVIKLMKQVNDAKNDSHT